MRQSNSLLAGVLLLLSLGAIADDEDVYQDPAMRSVEVPEQPGEGEVRFPAYPDLSAAIEVPMGSQYPFSVLVDPASISVDNHRDVRFTVILRSGTGATNVAYEAIRCNSHQYRRYGYGSSGQFKPQPDSEWRYLGRGDADRYRDTLMRYYFCPLPARREAQALASRLRRGISASDYGNP